MVFCFLCVHKKFTLYALNINEDIISYLRNDIRSYIYYFTEVHMKTKVLAMVAVICMTAVFSGCHSIDERKSEDDRPKAIADEYQETIQADGCELVYKTSPESVDIGETYFGNILNRHGINGYEIDVTAENEITVFVPWIEDPDDAVALIGTPKELSFVDSNGKVVLTGDDIINAEAIYGDSYGNGTASWFISLTFDSSASKAFGDATEEMAALAGTGNNYIRIMLGDDVISSPSVNERIDSSECVINGDFTKEQAKEIASGICLRMSYELVSAKKASRTVTVKTEYGKMLDEISELLDKPIDDITQSDIASIDAISFQIIMTGGYGDIIEQDMTDEIRYDKTIILCKGDDEVTYSADHSGFEKCLGYLTGIRSLTVFKFEYLSALDMEDPDTTEFDFSLIPANRFDALETIFISGVPVKNLDMIASYKSLTDIGLCDVGITDISALSALDNDKIKSIDLSGNTIDDLSPIAHIDEEKIVYEDYE